MKDFDLQKHLMTGATLDAAEIRKGYGLTETDLDLAIFSARKKGCPVVYKEGKIFRAKNKDEYELALFKEILERKGMKEGNIETRLVKADASVYASKKGSDIETRS